MYNQSKTRFRGMPNRRPARRGRSTSGRFSKIDPAQYVQKAEEATEAEVFTPKHRFSDFNFNRFLQNNIDARGYVSPTPIQDQSIPLIMSGRDVIGIAETGTGKTAAFLLPMIDKVFGDRNATVLIVAPTRELAVQIEDELRLFSYNLRIGSALLIGGAGFGNQVKMLQRNPQFVIGTPGRIKDHLNRRTLRIHNCANLVLDEADRMVEMGFINDVKFILAQLNPVRHSLFFSATITPTISQLITTFMNQPATVSVKRRETAKNIDQNVVHYTDSFHRLTLLNELLAQPEFNKVLIFGRTKHGVEKLSEVLNERGHQAVSIHGNKNQNQRQRALDDFKENKAKVLVATDVAARGLDIPNVTHVINFEVPENYSDYIHRIGRTGRADKQGCALTFVQGVSA